MSRNRLIFELAVSLLYFEQLLERVMELYGWQIFTKLK